MLLKITLPVITCRSSMQSLNITANHSLAGSVAGVYPCAHRIESGRPAGQKDTLKVTRWVIAEETTSSKRRKVSSVSSTLSIDVAMQIQKKYQHMQQRHSLLSASACRLLLLKTCPDQSSSLTLNELTGTSQLELLRAIAKVLRAASWREHSWAVGCYFQVRNEINLYWHQCSMNYMEVARNYTLPRALDSTFKYNSCWQSLVQWLILACVSC